MPILAEEASIFPESLLDEHPDSPSPPRWMAVYTKARQEKALARHLLQHEVRFYLPLVTKQNMIRGRVVQTWLPLFSGYLFVQGGEAERLHCLTSNRVSQIIEVHDSATLTHDLQNIQRLIQADAPLTVERRLQPGQLVRVVAGPMMGLEGMVVTYRGKTKLVISVQFLQQGVSLKIDGCVLEPIG